MPGLLETCRDLFDTDDLYKVLGINKTASDVEVKRGYRKTSLQVHPDRAEAGDKEIATKKFQAVSQAYSILSDQNKRTAYDDTGEVDDEADIQQDKDWFDYWRILFPKITEEDILNFEKNYKGSDEERSDLKEAYLQFHGDMDQILENVMCSAVDDEPRFTKLIREMIKKKEVPEFPDFKKSKENKQKKSARKRQAEKEAAEVEEVRKMLGVDENESLTAIIQKKQQSRGAQADDFFSQLEAKYAKPKQKSKKK